MPDVSDMSRYLGQRSFSRVLMFPILFQHFFREWFRFEIEAKQLHGLIS
jgi:hypothetical protein